MPRPVTRYLTEFLRWYGSEPYNETPPLADTLTPVVIVDDQTHLVQPAPACFWAQRSYEGSTAGQYSGTELHTLRPAIVTFNSNESGPRWKVSPVTLLLAGVSGAGGEVVTVNGPNHGDVNVGSSTVNPGEFPQWTGTSSGYTNTFPFVLPAGFFLSIWDSALGTGAISVTWMVQEIPDRHDIPDVRT